MDMTMKNSNRKIRQSKKTPQPLSQAEIIRKINASTRKSYKLFELLIWNKDRYESTK